MKHVLSFVAIITSPTDSNTNTQIQTIANTLTKNIQEATKDKAKNNDRIKFFERQARRKNVHGLKESFSMNEKKQLLLSLKEMLNIKAAPSEIDYLSKKVREVYQ